MPKEDIELSIVFANKTEKDIVLRKELEELQPRVKVTFALDNPPENWGGLKGFVTEEALKSLCPLNDPNTLYVHCGPKGMNTSIKQLFEKKYPESKLFKF